MHLVPVVVINVAETVESTFPSSTQHELAKMRIEAIRDYCNEVLRKSETNNFRKKKAR